MGQKRELPNCPYTSCHRWRSLDCLAEELEDPFGTENNDLPLDAICNAIEIDLLQMNDEAEIPAKILPDRHYQLT